MALTLCLVLYRTKTTLYSVRGNRRKKEKKQITSASKKVRMHFPPGRPTADNIEALCRDQKLRPVFKTNCMPGEGYMWLVRQAKAINRIEKRYKQCCKKEQGVLDCADLKVKQKKLQTQIFEFSHF